MVELPWVENCVALAMPSGWSKGLGWELGTLDGLLVSSHRGEETVTKLLSLSFCCSPRPSRCSWLVMDAIHEVMNGGMAHLPNNFWY